MALAQQVSRIRARRAARTRAAPAEPHVVVVGAGFAGPAAARGLLRRLRGRARITVIDQRDHFVYLPLLPEVAVGR
ncbi:NAD(P)-binding protein [Nocardia sp. NPDC052278]|uniref:NAD(P)-binding protein n=1 Tax=unclassified Nocardia TaxID=2637762 RepID=UPI0036CD0C42